MTAPSTGGRLAFKKIDICNHLLEPKQFKLGRCLDHVLKQMRLSRIGKK